MWVSNLKRSAARVVAPAFALLCLAAGCGESEQSAPALEPFTTMQTLTWVAIEPEQCLSNPWEQDWLAQHGGDYEAYPKDNTVPGLEPEEIKIIKEYYLARDVVVSDTATAPKYEAVCLSCACPEGHTLFLRVREQDVATMIGFGYRIEAPPAPIESRSL